MDARCPGGAYQVVQPARTFDWEYFLPRRVAKPRGYVGGKAHPGKGPMKFSCWIR
jgi:hypothetical protein